MKKLFLLSAATLFVFASVNAQTEVALRSDITKNKAGEKMLKKEIKEDKKGLQKLKKLKGNEVSYQTKQAFSSDFSNAPVANWERGPYYDVATFTKDGQQMTAYYDFDAKLVGTVTKKTFADLPPNAQATIARKYPGYKNRNVIFYDDNELNDSDMILYGHQFQDADNYFAELSNAGKTIIVEIDMNGNVAYFTQLK